MRAEGVAHLAQGGTVPAQSGWPGHQRVYACLRRATPGHDARLLIPSRVIGGLVMPAHAGIHDCMPRDEIRRGGSSKTGMAGTSPAMTPNVVAVLVPIHLSKSPRRAPQIPVVENK